MFKKEEQIGREISELYRMGSSFLSKKFSKYGIGSGQYLFLAKLYRMEGISQERLSEILNMDKATTARGLAKLEEKGYIIRRKNQEDKRANEVYLTQKAKDIKVEFFDILGEWNNKLLLPLTKDEREQVMYLLSKITTETSKKEGDIDE